MANGFTPSFPLQIDQIDGDYVLITNTNRLVRQNLTNLILTVPGERIMDPLFGVGIQRYLFQNKTTATAETIRNAISTQVRKYMPFLTINNITFPFVEENSNYLDMIITYTIQPTSTVDDLILQIKI